MLSGWIVLYISLGKKAIASWYYCTCQAENKAAGKMRIPHPPGGHMHNRSIKTQVFFEKKQNVKDHSVDVSGRASDRKTSRFSTYAGPMENQNDVNGSSRSTEATAAPQSLMVPARMTPSGLTILL